MTENSRGIYNKLFENDRDKAEAFDMIAENFYFGNFGSMSKSDLEVLMFSIYIERILKISEEDESTYSDYTLSKSLGIMQNRVNTLKVKKELKYPHENFDWRKSFARAYENARYEKGKICMHISDRNVYLELKNAIETMGGYVDVTLNSNLLKVSPAYFLDLILSISDEDERCRLKEIIEERAREEKLIINDEVPKTWGSIFRGLGTDAVCSIIETYVEKYVEKYVPVSGDILKRILNKTYNMIKKRM